MSVNPLQFQENEEKFQRQLARSGWMMPLLTFISLLSFGGLLYVLSQSPGIDSVFPSGFLLGLASGFISTAIIFYFYEYVFTQRMEKRALFGRQSAVRRRFAAAELKKNAAWDRWKASLDVLNQLSSGNVSAWQPNTRAEAQTMLDALNAALTALHEYDDIEEERTIVARDFLQIQSEDGSKTDIEDMLDVLLRLAKERRERRVIGGQLWAETQRLIPLLPTLP